MSSWVWWAIGTLGLGGTLLVVAGFVVGWPVLLGSKIGRIAIAVGLGVLAVLGFAAQQRAAGRAEERARLKALTEKEVAGAAAERRRIDSLTDNQVDEELSRWDRKP